MVNYKVLCHFFCLPAYGDAFLLFLTFFLQFLTREEEDFYVVVVVVVFHLCFRAGLVDFLNLS